MPNGCHIYANTSDMEKAIMFAYPKFEHALLHWKYVLWCCNNCPGINISDQEIDSQYSDTTP